MHALTSRAASAARCASARASEATTAKPRPASLARAASSRVSLTMRCARGALGGRADGGGDLVHRRRGLLARGRLLFGAHRQIVGGLTKVLWPPIDLMARTGEIGQRCAHAQPHRLETVGQRLIFGWQPRERRGQVAFRPLVEHRADRQDLRSAPRKRIDLRDERLFRTGNGCGIGQSRQELQRMTIRRRQPSNVLRSFSRSPEPMTRNGNNHFVSYPFFTSV